MNRSIGALLRACLWLLFVVAGAAHAQTATTTTLRTSGAGPFTYGSGIGLIATVTAVPQNGNIPVGDTVTFSEGGVTLGTASVTQSKRSVTVNFTAAGLNVNTHNIVATYNGTATNATSASDPLAVSVVQAGTTTSMTASPSPAGYGVPVTLTATVVSPGAETGTVTFLDGTTPIGSPATVGANGVATLTTSSLSIGAHSLKAGYGGDTNNLASNSTVVSLTINKVASTTSVASSANPSTYPQAVTFTATVTGLNPTGNVTFKDGTTALGTVALSGGTASFTTTATLSVANHNITAVYAGDANNLTSTSSPVLVQQVNKAPTTTTISTSNPQVDPGQQVTLTATVTGVSPTGTLFFYDGATQLAQKTLSGSGNTLSTTYSTSNLAVGTHNITATYQGNSQNATSTSTPVLEQKVNRYPTSISLTTNPPGPTVTLTYGTSLMTNLTMNTTIANQSGTFEWYDNGTLYHSNQYTGGTPVTISSGKVFSAGSHLITAKYTGDANYQPSTAPQTITLTVNKANTTTSMSVAPSGAVSYGTSQTISGTVSSPGPVTGSVTIKDANGTTVATPPLSGNAYTATVVLPAGNRTITANYPGDANNNASTGSATVNVTAAASSVVVTPSANPAQAGQSVTFTANLSGVTNAGGTITFKDGATTIGTAQPVSANAASVTTSSLAAGTHNITASYSGDGNNAPATSPAIMQNVTSIALVSSANPARINQQVTYTATVTGNSPTGNVTFMDGASSLATVPLASGVATYTGALGQATHSLTAVYAGDANNASVTSAVLTQVVNDGTSQLALIANPPSANVGDTVTLYATVTGNHPTGTVTFTEGATTFGQNTLDSGSTGGTLTGLAAGVHTITASYSGDASNLASTNSTLVLVTARGPYTWNYEYDPVGRINKQVDPNTLDTNFEYDALGRRVKVSQPQNTGSADRTITQFGWNVGDSLTSVTDPRNLATNYTVDGIGNTKAEGSPDRGALSYSVDGNGNLTQKTDARGKVTTYTYDSLNRLRTISYQTGTGTVFEYDGGSSPTPNEAGELTKMTDESGSTTYAHDAMGRLTLKTVAIQGRTFTVGYQWGDSGNEMDKLKRITYPSGAQVNYSYDTNGMVSGITVTPAGGSQTTLMSNVTYNVDGNPTGWLWSDGTPRTIGYDSAGMVASYTLGNPNGTGNAAGTTRLLKRDSSGRITAYIHTNNQSSLDQSFTYDSLDRLTGQTTNTTSYGYAYDANGNRTSRVIGGNTYTNTVASNSNRITQAQDVGGAANYQHDAAGNVTNDGASTFTYSDRGRMASANTPSGNVTYLTNGLEQRAYKSGPGGSRHFVHNESGTMLGQYDSSGGSIHETIYVGAVPVGVMKQGNIYNLYADQISTPRVLTKQDHTIVWRWDGAEAFGATDPDQNPSGLGAFAFDQRFPGQTADGETSLFDNWNRQFDPKRRGGYIQSDPIGLKGGMNTYSYAGNRPTSAYDSNGLDCVSSAGMTTCSFPGGPKFRVPTPPGFEDYTSRNLLYHSYTVANPLGSATAKCVIDEITKNPTPGNPNAATAQGAMNNANVPFFDNPVASYVTTDMNTGATVVVNMTIGNSFFTHGFVAKMVVDGQARTYGEGTSMAQSPFVAYPLNPLLGDLFQWAAAQGLWGSQVGALVEKCKCRENQ